MTLFEVDEAANRIREELMWMQISFLVPHSTKN